MLDELEPDSSEYVNGTAKLVDYKTWQDRDGKYWLKPVSQNCIIALQPEGMPFPMLAPKFCVGSLRELDAVTDTLRDSGFTRYHYLAPVQPMTPQQYIKLALRTEAPSAAARDRLLAQLDGVDMMRLLHALIGMVTEVGEMFDTFKRTIYYGAPLNKDNLSEERGDQGWYGALYDDVLGLDPIKVMEGNIAKLRARFPDKFSSVSALVRDTEAEDAARRIHTFGNIQLVSDIKVVDE